MQCRLTIYYRTGKLEVDGISLPATRDRSESVKIHNIGVKKFRLLLRKKKRNSDDFIVYQVRNINNLTTACSSDCILQDEELKRIREEFSTVFTEEPKDGLPRKRNVDHIMEIYPESTPPHRGIFQLSPAELLATK